MHNDKIGNVRVIEMLLRESSKALEERALSFCIDKESDLDVVCDNVLNF